MTLLLLSPLGATGNCATAERIRSLLISEGFKCVLEPVDSFSSASEVTEYINANYIQCVLAIHLWRSGSLLHGCEVPVAVILGGTDINEHYKDTGRMKVMTKMAHKAKCLIAFSQAMVKQTLSLWPHCEGKIICQPQGFSCNLLSFPKNKHNIQCLAEQESRFPGDRDTITFLLVAGIRPVKDPLFLAPIVSAWHKEDRRVHMVIVGPELDASFTEEVKNELTRYPGVLLFPELPKRDLLIAMENSFALVNSSISEGMSGAIIEAMYLRVPVLARNNPGNAAVIQHGYNGLLFNSPEDFLKHAKDLVSSKDLQRQLTNRAYEYVTEVHCVEKEAATYCSVVRTLSSDQNSNDIDICPRTGLLS